MQKSTIINFYETWKSLLEPLISLDYQRKTWFRLEGSEVSSFEDSIGEVRQRYLDLLDNKLRPLYKDEFVDLMKQFYEKITEYVSDDDSLLNSVYENRLLNDPKWLSIVALAQNIYEVLNKRIEEVKSDKR